MPVARANVTYFHNDLLGSPVLATDASGDVLWSAAYHPFGAREQSVESYANSLGNNRWYAGHVEDDAAGLIYMQGRYYDAVVGRFISVDPAAVRPAFPATFNRYAYALNNPYRYFDPDGRDALAISYDGSFILGAGVAASGGFYVTYPGEDYAPLDVGTFESAGIGVGADVAMMVGVSALRGNRENLEGASAVAGVTVPLTGLSGPSVDYETIVNIDTGEWAGQSIGVGVSPFPSASVSTFTSEITFSLRDYLGSGGGNPNTQQDPGETAALIWYGFIAG